MPRPTPGSSYTVQPGDTFPSIATRAYGLSERWPLIRNANQLQFSVSNQEEVSPGEVIYIPVDPEIEFLRNQ